MSEEKKDLRELLQNSKVQKVEVKNELEKSFISYAMAVNVSRAIPDVRDGLKPVHRRILYDMAEQNLFHTHKFVKSATIVGDVLGHYHPHGDSSVYDALVRLAQDFRNLPSRALMVIGKTPLTEDLYRPFIKAEYEKKYAVNIRNRFKSESMHLIITNY